jgi:hypothetical protein
MNDYGVRRYGQPMRRNLADPAYEPSDDDLRELSQKAFEHLAAAKREADAEIRKRIARLSDEAMKQLAAMQSTQS